MKAPEACTSLQEIRAEIDRLDRQVLHALGQRLGYVKAAAQFKASEGAVSAPDRVESQLTQLRAWAAEEGLDPNEIVRIYRQLIDYFIAEQLALWRTQREQS